MHTRQLTQASTVGAGIVPGVLWFNAADLGHTHGHVHVHLQVPQFRHTLAFLGKKVDLFDMESVM
jgi:hypothetical protein